MNSGWKRTAAAVGLSLALSLGVAPAFGDEDDPTAYLYTGSCAELPTATVVDEIDDLNDDDDDLNDVWERIGNNQERPDGLLGTEDDVDDISSVQEVADGDFAVVVHQGEAISSPVLVCGELDGTITEDVLLLSLDEVEASGFEGRVNVQLDNDDNDDDDDDVEFTVGIYPTGSVEPLSSSTPTG